MQVQSYAWDSDLPLTQTGATDVVSKTNARGLSISLLTTGLAIDLACAMGDAVVTAERPPHVALACARPHSSTNAQGLAKTEGQCPTALGTEA
ncbi:MAG: hypothetical protein EAY75_01450 [Bacteroidetes bacterium]|nr:MAG: hypothetical protein EAY75_01450 [Bacteroidota bacterium]